MPESTLQKAMKIAEEKSIKAYRDGLCLGCAKGFSKGADIVFEICDEDGEPYPFHLACAAGRIAYEEEKKGQINAG